MFTASSRYALLQQPAPIFVTLYSLDSICLFIVYSPQVLDYTQYYLDIGNANRLGEAEWQPEYNLTNYYGLQEISANSLHNLVEKFMQDRPSANYLFSKYVIGFFYLTILNRKYWFHHCSYLHRSNEGSI